jgi:hypothetical protein
MATPSELLAEVNDAISKILTGAQEYVMSDRRRVTRADLETLRKWRKELQHEVALENGTSGVQYLTFRGPR